MLFKHGASTLKGEPPVKHDELISAKQNSKYEHEALCFRRYNHRNLIINYCRGLFISIC